jgi:hypothetical protein
MLLGGATPREGVVKLLDPSVPEFNLDDWRRRPERERVRMMCESWALEGFGAPFVAYLLYVLKIAAYVGAWAWFVGRDPNVAGWSDVGSWWATATAFQKATMLFEVLGFGCGSGPLTARYLPPFVAFTHFLRPGTIRLAPWPDTVPGTAGDRRTIIDVLLYAALVATAVRALLSPDALTTTDLLPMVVLLPLAGLRDKTIFLAARAEHYWSLLIVFLLAGGDTTVLFAGAIFVQVAIWWGAATSKLNRHFPSVVAIMFSNSPLPHPRALRKAMYRDFPHDLRPSWLASTLAHGGTTIEYLFPLLLLLDGGGPLGTVSIVAMAVLLAFHTFITTSFPMGVPIEWNVLFVYSMFVLFGAHPEVAVTDLADAPVLLGLLVARILVGPVLGNLRPDLVSFLPSMRYYAGNWAASTWLFKPGAEAKLDEHLTKTAPTISRQLDILYDDDVAAALKGKVRAFRSMHLHGRIHNAVLNDVVDDPDAWEITDGEPIAGVALGWNFGDGHLHDEQFLAVLQARCGFGSGEVRMIAVESQPFHRPTLRWRYVDAVDGVLASGVVDVNDLLDHQPFPEPGSVPLHLDECPRVGSTPAVR